MFQKSIILKIKDFFFIFDNNVVIQVRWLLCEKYLEFFHVWSVIEWSIYDMWSSDLPVNCDFVTFS
jgi:hypothetical protein